MVECRLTFALIAIAYPLYLIWINSYLKAAEATLGGRLSGNLAGLLLLRNPAAGIGLLQQAYNNPSSMPAVFNSETIRHAQGKLREFNDLNLASKPRSLVKRILVGIIILLLVGFMLFGVFLFYVSHA